MADVVILPGAFVPAIERPTPCADVLRSALDAGLRDVVVVGRGIDGSIALWASQVDADAAIGLLMRGVSELARAEQEAAEGHEG